MSAAALLRLAWINGIAGGDLLPAGNRADWLHCADRLIRELKSPSLPEALNA